MLIEKVKTSIIHDFKMYATPLSRNANILIHVSEKYFFQSETVASSRSWTCWCRRSTTGWRSSTWRATISRRLKKLFHYHKFVILKELHQAHKCLEFDFFFYWVSVIYFLAELVLPKETAGKDSSEGIDEIEEPFDENKISTILPSKKKSSKKQKWKNLTKNVLKVFF